jgi:hypothetical protein
MNSAPLVLLPLAAVALLSSQPSRNSVATHAEADQIAAILDRPEYRALFAQLQGVVGTAEVSDERDQNPYSDRRRRTRSHTHEQGLHTGHLTRPELTQSEGYFSAARGLTPEDEWQQMFPRYALRLAVAR